MSRETDSSSSGPQGRGGAAYPSGTPPYGSRQYPSLHPQQDAQEEADAEPAPPADQPRTETTLTTRIRINIPGSRPIPPVVMRTPMSDVDARGEGTATRTAERTGSVPRPEPAKAAQAPAEAQRPAEAAEEPKPAGEKPTSDWFAPRKAAQQGRTGSGTGAAAIAGAAAPATAPGDQHGQSPYYADGTRPSAGDGSLAGLAAGAGTSTGTNGFPSGGPTTPPLGIRTPGASGAPNGPTTGPAAGDSSLGAPPSATPPLGTPSLSPMVPPAEGGGRGLSDDTAELTPQPPAPEPGGHVSGATLSSGIPVVPPEHRSPFPGPVQPGGTPQAGPSAHPSGIEGPGQGDGFSEPDRPGPVEGEPPAGPAPAASAKPAKPAKKGRSKLMLLGVAVVVAAGGVYGAGLLMNHSDVPKGTTVLGVDIGGGTRDEAVIKLDSALGKRAAAPLRLTVDGKTQELSPDKAGLRLDSQATVRAAAGSDYNPVSVVGSLFGGARVAEPVIPVDEEKLSVALTDLAGTSGTAAEGTIKFEPGRAVAVPGKAGKALDVNHSIISVRDAYRAQVQTGRTENVELPSTTREPTVSQAELDRAMKEFAEPAMSGLITIKAGDKQIQFGPAKSLPKILSMKAVDGKLVDVYDRDAIDQLLEGVFDGITITRADGKQHPVSSADVAAAMRQALRGTTPEERTQVIDLDPS
ncbi:hypothetical protein [Streptomyces hebeiensis]